MERCFHPTPSGVLSPVLSSVAAVSTNDVWAAGSYYDSNYVTHTLIEQWNGTSWSIVPSPNVAGQNNGLNNIAVVSSKAIWAAGSIFDINTGVGKTLIEKWNGKKWKIISNPNPSSTSTVFAGIAAISAKNVWAVGYYQNSKSKFFSLIEHWNGKQWKIVPASIPGSSNSLLSAVASIPGTSTLWSIGSRYKKNGDELTLTEYYC